MNYDQYVALEELYYSTDGPNWMWSSDPSLGVPWNFDNYTLYNPCRQLWQGLLCLTANCPSTGCNIITINLSGLGLNGTLMDLNGSFPQVYTMRLSENYLYGTLPIISNMPFLNILNLSYNSFVGAIPDMFQELPGIRFLLLSSNQLEGTIPPSLYNISLLNNLNLRDNMMQDTLPDNIGSLFPVLTTLNLANNMFYGTVPASLFTMRNITFLYISNNKFHGELQVQPLEQLLMLRASRNHFTGTFPSLICNCSVLEYISLYDNWFTGTIPTCLSKLPNLFLMQLQYNLFTGPVRHVFDNSVQQALSIIDLSNNGITGTLPADLFQLPALSSLAAGKNCFHGQIPSTVCNASSYLNTLALDGLGTSSFCESSVWDPFGLFNSQFGGLLTGTLPHCVWSLPAIQVLHLSGNGLSGSLPDFHHCNGSCGISTSLQDVGLTHNLLTEDIPNAFRKFPFENLDLSYNKLKGYIQDMTNLNLSYTSSGSGASLNLENNRLSGILPSEFREAYDINVLSGNLFACGKDGNKDLAKHDPGSHNAICGSQELDGSITTWAISLLIATLVFSLFVFTKRHAQGSFRFIKKVWNYVAYTVSYVDNVHRLLDEDNDEIKQWANAYRLFSVLNLIRKLSWLIFGFAFLFCLPVYLIFLRVDRGKYSMQTNQYTWISSAVFLTGQPPAAVLIFLWTLLILILSYLVNTHYGGLYTSSKQATESTDVMMSVESADMSWKSNFELSSKSDQTASSVFNMLHSYAQSQNVAAEQDESMKQQEPNTEMEAVQLPSSKSNRFFSSSTSSSRQSSKTVDTTDSVAISFLTMRFSDVVAYEKWKEIWKMRGIKTIIFILNTLAVISINAAYLVVQNADDISSASKIAVQVLMAGFKLFWNVFMLRVLMTWLPQEKHSIELHVGMLAFNSIIAPCIATAFTDSSCFRECFIRADSIETSYDVTSCVESYQYLDYTTGTWKTACTHYQTRTFTTIFTPSFIYYYTCSSKLLTAYTPVFVYTYTILLFLLPIFYGSLAMLPRVRFPVWLLTSLDGVLRPQDRGDVSFRKL
ncbi:hypothetical protein EON65_20640, partial [archaeon]